MELGLRRLIEVAIPDYKTTFYISKLHIKLWIGIQGFIREFSLVYCIISDWMFSLALCRVFPRQLYMDSSQMPVCVCVCVCLRNYWLDFFVFTISRFRSLNLIGNRILIQNAEDNYGKRHPELGTTSEHKAYYSHGVRWLLFSCTIRSHRKVKYEGNPMIRPGLVFLEMN